MSTIAEHNADAKQRHKEYNDMPLQFDVKCWACRRTSKPKWFSAYWLLHRAHIVNKPRLKDRRVVLLLCPVCHMLQEGENVPDAGDQPGLTLSEMLWLKQRHDPEFYDLELMTQCSVSNLPEPELGEWYMQRQDTNSDVIPRPGEVAGRLVADYRATGLIIGGSLSFEQYENAMRTTERMTFSHQWWIGDLINYGEQHFGDDHTQAISCTGHALTTLLTYAEISRLIPFDRRRESLSFSAHRTVAYLDDDDQCAALDWGEQNNASSRELKAAVKRFKETGSFGEIELVFEREPDGDDGEGVELDAVKTDEVVARARARVPDLIRSLRLNLDNLGADGRFDKSLDEMEEFAR